MGLILDTSIVITGERRGHSVPQILAQIRDTWGETEIGLSAVTIAELTHGIQRAGLAAQRERQQAFVDEVTATVKVHAVTAVIAQRAGVILGSGGRTGIDDAVNGSAHRGDCPRTRLRSCDPQRSALREHTGPACAARVTTRGRNN